MFDKCQNIICKNMSTDEREIDIIDLIETICKKWRMIICFMLVGFIIGGIVSVSRAFYYKSNASIDMLKKSASKTLTLAEKELDKLETSDELKENADNNIIAYEIKENIYEMQKEYMEKSIYYNIDAMRVNIVQLSYHLDNHYEVTYPVIEKYNNIADIIQYYSAKIVSDDVCYKVMTEVYPDSETKYMKELIQPIVTSTSNMDIYIYADSEENAEKITAVIKDEMQIITEDIALIYGEVDAKLQMEQALQVNDSTMSKEHGAVVQNFSEAYNEMQKVEKTMSGEQLEYFKAKLALKKLEKNSEEKETKLLSLISKKIIVLVGIIGMAVSIAYTCCMYLMSGIIYTSNNLIQITKVVSFGDFAKDADVSNVIDKMINGIFHKKNRFISKEQRIEVVSGNIVKILKNRNINKLYLISTRKVADSKNLITLVKNISDGKIEVVLLDEFLDNKDGLSNITNTSSVLICEKLRESVYEEVEQEMNLVGLYGADILGCLTI